MPSPEETVQPSPSPDAREDVDQFSETLRLALVTGVGPRLRQVLLERFGSSSAVLAAAPSDLRETPGVGPVLVRRIVEARDRQDAEEQIELAKQYGIALIDESMPDYPRLLKEIHDPPPVLFVRGSLTGDDNLAVAIVGTRHASRYGLMMAERLAGNLARSGLTVVSGLARGIDGAAHRGALAAGGRTVGVLASGVRNVYPPEHDDLADAICRQGAVLSENRLDFRPIAGSFPQRNRIISGLSLGVIVVEAAERSGALITARHAMEQGREVFAVPGRVDQRQSHGCHRLIRDGARLVESIDDVLEELGPLVEATLRSDGSVVHHPAELKLNDLERAVLDQIESTPTAVDQVIVGCGLPVSRVLAALSVLEMRHLITRVSGTLVERR